jgi:hypothetical protein
MGSHRNGISYPPGCERRESQVVSVKSVAIILKRVYQKAKGISRPKSISENPNKNKILYVP